MAQAQLRGPQVILHRPRPWWVLGNQPMPHWPSLRLAQRHRQDTKSTDLHFGQVWGFRLELALGLRGEVLAQEPSAVSGVAWEGELGKEWGNEMDLEEALEEV